MEATRSSKTTTWYHNTEDIDYRKRLLQEVRRIGILNETPFVLPWLMNNPWDNQLTSVYVRKVSYKLPIFYDNQELGGSSFIKFTIFTVNARHTDCHFSLLF